MLRGEWLFFEKLGERERERERESFLSLLEEADP